MFLPVKQKSNGLARGRLLPPHSLATDFKPLAISFILSASSEEGSRGHINALASSGADISCADALILGPGAVHVTTLRRPLRQEMAQRATQQLLHSWLWAKSDWPLTEFSQQSEESPTELLLTSCHDRNLTCAEAHQAVCEISSHAAKPAKSNTW